jgi:dipeptidyl aminopeptidase/acylaminoacyl peptidase
MTRRALLAAACVAAVAFAPPAAAVARAQSPAATTAPGRGTLAAKRAITCADFAAVKNVSDPQISPDGRTALFAVRSTDVDANKRTTVTYAMPVAGGAMRQFPDANTKASEARWSPDGRRVAYVAGGQLWVADASGANATQLTKLNGGATGPVWAPSGDRVAFTSSVYPECTGTEADACNAAKEKARDTSKVKAHVADNLLYRHWTAYDEGQRSHLFVVSPAGGGSPRDVTDGVAYDVPPGPFGGSEGYAFSPDGKELAYTAKDAGREAAWSTDVNVYTVPVDGGSATVITAANKGADQNPVYSPDGKWIAYASQRTPGYESDRWRLMAYDRASKQSRELLPSWDRNADAYLFAGDGRALFVQTTDAGRDKVYRVALDARGGVVGAPQVVVSGHNNTGFSVSRDGRTALWLRDATAQPAEVWAATVPARGAAAQARALTHVNDSLVAQLALNPAEDFWYKGAGGDSVQGFVVKPPHWEQGKKYPVVLLIHGGPQGAWLDNWHGRWNYQMFAATGAGLVIVNPRGSTGYGQQFVAGVSKDWGGKVVTDIMNGLDAALERNAWMDRDRVGAAGGSFGGYMVNWLAGHYPDRFKAFVTHAGVFNLENMYGATEEVWFPDWEYGAPYWDPKAMDEQYRKFSPHLFAKNFKVPHLVIDGELDYRVPYYEGVSLFTALQRQNVPSRLILFPDEGHWIGKPQNQRLWWGEVQGWLEKYLGTQESRTTS